MSSFWVDVVSALWLGILTSIMPCPLATNIAAISFLGRHVGKTGAVFLSGLLYTLGRVIAYVGVAVVVTASLLSVPSVALFLQTYLNKALGPVLVMVGVMLLGIIPMPTFGGGDLAGKGKKMVEKWGVWGALPLGVLFALAFCPSSAGIYFGSLIPLALARSSSVIMPTMYGIGTAVPVMGFAILIAVSVQSVGKVFRVLTSIEKWVRIVTGVILILVGIYLIVRYIAGVDLGF